MWLWMVLAADAADGPVRFERPVPEDGYDERAAELTDESIRRIEELLREPLPDEMRAELLLRLAELNASKARRLRLAEMEAAGAPSASVAVHERAIAVYRAVLDRFPRYERADEAALALAYVLEELGRTAEADEALKRLVRSWPDSDALPDAWLLLGEHAFDAGNVPAAFQAYRRAAAFAEHPKRSYALYKLGWAQYNLGAFEDAARTLQRVVVDGLAVPPEDTVTLRMHEEALADLPRFFADAGLVDEGADWLRAQGRDDLARRALIAFADALHERGDWEGATRMMRRLLLEAPDPALHARLVRTLEQAGRHDEALAEVDRLLATHGPTDEADELLRRFAVAWHESARKRGRGPESDAWAVLAEEAYRRWLGAFTGRPDEAEVRYGQAELLYRLRRWGEAHDGYAAVVDLGGPRAAASAEGALFAARELVGPGEPGPSTEHDQRLLDAVDRYVRVVPTGERVTDALYQAGWLLYHRRRFDEAAARFRDVIARDPRSREAEYAAHLILDALAIEESWDALATTAAAFAEQAQLGTATFRAEVGTIAVNASFRRVEAAYERDRDAAGAGAAFERFADTFPAEPLAMQALHDAAVRFGEAGRWADALRVRARLVDGWGAKSRWHAEDLRELGFGLEQIADFAGAAARYEALWALPDRGDESAALDAIWSAAVFRHALGDGARAADDYRHVAATQDARRFEARLRAGRLDEDPRALVALWEDAAAPADVRLAAALAAGELLRPAERDRLYVRAVELEGDPAVVARMRRVLSEPPIAAYRAIRLEGDLARAMGHKVRALHAAEAALTAVVDTGAGPEGLEALVTVGELYRDLARDLEASPTPAELTPEQALIYRRRLADQAWRLDERAVDAFALAVERSAELSLYGEPAARAVRALGLLRPDDFHGLPEELPAAGMLATASAKRPAYETALE